MKILLIIAAGATILSAGGNIYPTSKCGLFTDEYMMYSGVVDPCIDTGIPNAFPGQKLLNKKIYFHTSIYFKKGILTQESLQSLQELKNIIENRSSNYYVSVVGHTAWYEDSNRKVELNAWSTFWQNIGKSSMMRSNLAETVNSRIEAVYNHLNKEEHISTSRLYTENRLARDPISTEATQEGRMHNERVDIALYY